MNLDVTRGLYTLMGSDPYTGIKRIWIRSTPDAPATGGLHEEAASISWNYPVEFLSTIVLTGVTQGHTRSVSPLHGLGTKSLARQRVRRATRCQLLRRGMSAVTS